MNMTVKRNGWYGLILFAAMSALCRAQGPVDNLYIITLTADTDTTAVVKLGSSSGAFRVDDDMGVTDNQLGLSHANLELLFVSPYERRLVITLKPRAGGNGEIAVKSTGGTVLATVKVESPKAEKPKKKPKLDNAKIAVGGAVTDSFRLTSGKGAKGSLLLFGGPITGKPVVQSLSADITIGEAVTGADAVVVPIEVNEGHSLASGDLTFVVTLDGGERILVLIPMRVAVAEKVVHTLDTPKYSSDGYVSDTVKVDAGKGSSGSIVMTGGPFGDELKVELNGVSGVTLGTPVITGKGAVATIPVVVDKEHDLENGRLSLKVILADGDVRHLYMPLRVEHEADRGFLVFAVVKTILGTAPTGEFSDMFLRFNIARNCFALFQSDVSAFIAPAIVRDSTGTKYGENSISGNWRFKEIKGAQSTFDIFIGVSGIYYLESSFTGAHIGMMVTHGPLISTYVTFGYARRWFNRNRSIGAYEPGVTRKTSDVLAQLESSHPIAYPDNLYLQFALYAMEIPFLNKLRIKGSLLTPMTGNQKVRLDEPWTKDVQFRVALEVLLGPVLEF